MRSGSTSIKIFLNVNEAMQLPSITHKVLGNNNCGVMETKSTIIDNFNVSSNISCNLYTGNSQLYIVPPIDSKGTRINISDRPILCMSYTKDGNELVVGSADHALYSVNIKYPNKKPIQMYSKRYGHTDWVTSCSHLIDGRIVSSAMDGKLCIWSSDRRSCIVGHRGSISKVLSDCQYNIIVSCGYDGNINIWDVNGRKGGSNIAMFEGHNTPVIDCIYSNKTLVSGSRDGVLCFWDMITGQLMNRINAHNGQISVLQSTSNNGNQFISGGIDGQVKVWDIREKYPVLYKSIPVNRSRENKMVAAVSCMIGTEATSGTNSETDTGDMCRHIVTGGADGSVVILDTRMNFTELHRWKYHKSSVTALYAVGDNCIFSGDALGMMHCYDIATSSNSNESILGIDRDVEGIGLRYGLGASENSAVKGICCIDRKIVTIGEDGKILIFIYDS